MSGNSAKISCEESAKLKSVIVKKQSGRQRKLKKIMSNYKRMSESSDQTNLEASKSSDSVIYVGRYMPAETYPLVDLTQSVTNVDEGSASSSMYRFPTVSKPKSSGTSLVRNGDLACTVSASEITDSMAKTNLNLHKPSKSASSLSVSNGKGRGKKQKSPSVQQKKRFEKVTALNEKDHAILEESLEIAEDFALLENCHPEPILNVDTSIEDLMAVYGVSANDNFF